MGIADELSKLNDLKEKGAITQAEFDEQKATLLNAPKAKRRAGGSAWKVFVGVIGAVGLVTLLVANFNKGSSALPACDSAQAKSTLSEAFNRSQFARAMNLSAVEVTDAKESSFDEKGGLRTCAGDIAMNNRNSAHVTYKMQGRPDGQYLLEFEVVEAPAAPQAAQVVAAPASLPQAPVSTPSADSAKPAVVTRYGPITITEDLHVLFQGRPLSPPLDGDNSLAVSQKFEIGADDVLLMQQTGGTGCPAQFYFVRVSAAGAGSTPAFGTCNDEPKVARDGDSVRVTLPGFAGNSQSNAEQQAAAKEVHVFVYRNGAVAEEGSAKNEAGVQSGPSFSCGGKPSAAEKLICDTPSLAQADAALARAYSATLARASDAASVKQQQRSWRSTRDACADVACMEAAYSNRTAELSR